MSQVPGAHEGYFLSVILTFNLGFEILPFYIPQIQDEMPHPALLSCPHFSGEGLEIISIKTKWQITIYCG
jgi:hypothetical protein